MAGEPPGGSARPTEAGEPDRLERARRAPCRGPGPCRRRRSRSARGRIGRPAGASPRSGPAAGRPARARRRLDRQALLGPAEHDPDGRRARRARGTSGRRTTAGPRPTAAVVVERELEPARAQRLGQAAGQRGPAAREPQAVLAGRLRTRRRRLGLADHGPAAGVDRLEPVLQDLDLARALDARAWTPRPRDRDRPPARASARRHGLRPGPTPSRPEIRWPSPRLDPEGRRPAVGSGHGRPRTTHRAPAPGAAVAPGRRPATNRTRCGVDAQPSRDPLAFRDASRNSARRSRPRPAPPPPGRPGQHDGQGAARRPTGVRDGVLMESDSTSRFSPRQAGRRRTPVTTPAGIGTLEDGSASE